MSEKFKNFGITYLNGSINNSTTTVVVDDASVFPSTGVFTILVDSELMRVTSVSSNTLTVVRGEEGTSAVSHSDNAGARSVQTARSVEAFRAEHIGSVAYGSYSSGRRGRINLPSDNPLGIYEDSAVNLLGPDLEPRILPVTGNFSWVNQGGATLTDFEDYSRLVAPANSGDSLRMREINLPSAPWSVTIEMDVGWVPVNFLTAGLYMRESGTSKIRTFGMENNATAALLACTNWTNATTFNSGATSRAIETLGRGWNLRYHKIYYDGTDIYYFAGPCKQSLVFFDVRAKNYFFTTAPDRVGFYANSNNAGRDAILNVYDWQEGTS